MLNKKTIIILLILFPLLIFVGFSAWIIVSEVTFVPERKVSELVEYFGTFQETIYNKYEQVPKQISGTPIEEEKIAYKYKLESSKQFITGKPIDVGTYDVIISVDGMGECQVKFKINQKIIHLGNEQCISIEYGKNNGQDRYWAGMQSLIANRIQFFDATGENYNLDLSEYSVIGMQNEDFYYTNANDKEGKAYKEKYNSLETTTNIIGSTYLATIKVDDNYLLDQGNTIFIKYKTVQINSNIYTIEEALEKNGDIVLLGDNTANNTVFTAFTSLDYYKDFKYKYALSSSSKLWITYDGTKTLTTTGTSGSIIYSVLYIPKKVTLDAYGEINVCGVIQTNHHSTYNRGVLFNNGIINVYNTLNSYGFINGIGRINANDNSTITDIMRFYNFTSGGPTLSMSNGKIFPLTCYSIHNISCELKIDSNAIYQVSYNIDVTIALSGYLTLVGKGGLFDLSDGYVIKSVEDTTGSFYTDRDKISKYSVTNQDITQRDIINIYGSFSDNIIDISTAGKGIKTGKDYAMPIGFMNISLKRDDMGNVGHGVLSQNSYKFLPGSRMQIDEGATLTISSGINVIFYDETYDDTFDYSSASAIQYVTKHDKWYASGRDDIGAQLIVNGKLISNGGLGGLIQTTSSTGQIHLSSNMATLKKMTKLTYSTTDKFIIGLGGTTTTTVDDTVYAQIYLFKNNLVNDESENAQKGIYYAIIDENDKKGWVTSENAKIFVFEFYDEDTLVTRKEILSPTNEYTITGLEYFYDKLFYDFLEWRDENGNTIKNKIITDTSQVIKCYAYFELTEYHFSYFGEYNDNDITNELVFSDKIEKFTINDFINNILNIDTKASYDDKYFNGWYLGIDKINGILVDHITIDQLILLIETFGNRIPLYCEFTDIQYFLIQFDDGNAEHTNFDSISVENGKTFDVDFYSNELMEYDTLKEYQYYFVGWYTSPNFTEGTEFTSDSIVDKNIILYAKWGQKNKITYQYPENQIIEYWYKMGTNVNITYDCSIIGHTFHGWETSNGEMYLKDDITTSTFSTDITLSANLTINQYAIYINGSGYSKVTIKANGKEINSGDKVDYNSTITIEIPNVQLLLWTKTTTCSITELKKTITNSKTIGGSGSATDSFIMPAFDVHIEIS